MTKEDQINEIMSFLEWMDRFKDDEFKAKVIYEFGEIAYNNDDWDIDQLFDQAWNNVLYDEAV
jgi:hypothetical protein